MTLRGTIMAKRAMLQVVEEILSNLESSRDWTERSYNEARETLKAFRDEHPDVENTDSTVQYYQRDIDNYGAQLNAYEAVVKALEKLV